MISWFLLLENEVAESLDEDMAESLDEVVVDDG